MRSETFHPARRAAPTRSRPLERAAFTITAIPKIDQCRGRWSFNNQFPTSNSQLPREKRRLRLGVGALGSWELGVDYFPVNLAFLFSRKAVVPSILSSDE